jgi:putative glycerol-1-phosphate prenyltransferase
MSILNRWETQVRNGKKELVWLVDPDKVNFATFQKQIQTYVSLGMKTLFVGGSFLTSYQIEELILKAKEITPEVQIVLFPGSILQVVPKGDALLFLSVVSSRNPDYLFGYHLQVAPILERCAMEVIPTAYILLDTGKQTTAHFITNSRGIPIDKPELVAYTALAAHYLGLRVIYLDGGSGASASATQEIVFAVKEKLPFIPLIVGGGIRSLETIKALFAAGADILVLSTIEEQEAFSLSPLFKYMQNALS